MTTSKHFLQTFWQLQNTFCKHFDNFKTLSENILTTSEQTFSAIVKYFDDFLEFFASIKHNLQTFWQLRKNVFKILRQHFLQKNKKLKIFFAKKFANSKYFLQTFWPLENTFRFGIFAENILTIRPRKIEFWQFGWCSNFFARLEVSPDNSTYPTIIWGRASCQRRPCSTSALGRTDESQKVIIFEN